MPKRPFDLERYPHTHYHDYDQNWIYKEIGILKAWLFSLTKLWAKLAEADAEKYAEILDEINRLIKKIQALIDSLTEMIMKMRDSFDTFTTSLENLLSLMGGHIEDIEERLENIEEEIDDIYDLLKQILTEEFSTKYLTYNSDYTFNFHNGYYCTQDSNSDYIVKRETVMDAGSEKFHSVQYLVTFNSFHMLRNSTTITADSTAYPQFAHGEDNEYAYIVDINIPELKDMIVDSVETESGVWNIRPVGARASWNVVTSGYALNNNVIRLMAQSIADGYNDQYKVYITLGYSSEITLNEGLNTTAVINAHYSETIS